MEGLLVILLLVLLIRWVILSRRLKKMNRRIEELSSSRREESSEAAIRELAERVEQLERILEQWIEGAPVSEVATVPEPVRPLSGPAEEALATPVPAQPGLPEAESVGQPVRADLTAPETTTPIPDPSIPPRPSVLAVWTQRIRELMAGEEWEVVIGGSLLNKIGIVVLVIGVALFMGYSLRHMGPHGRVATGVVTGLALLIGGVRLERIQRYTLFAKPLLGGGWALLYFTAYASHNLQAAKIVQQPIWALLLLSLVAAGMILHSLKYRSEIVTGFAYFLGFLTVAISQITGFTLAASLLLAVSLAAILRKTRWYYLSLFGVAATYLNHAIWLELRMEGFASRPPPETFWLSQGMLVLYWILFASFDFISRPETKGEGRAGTGTNLANTVAFLGLSFRQVWPAFPEERYLLAGLAGFAYIVSSALLYISRRRTLHLINGVIAASLIAVAIPLKPPAFPLAKHWLAIAWLVEGAIMLVLGIKFREAIFRVQAYGLSLAGLGALLAINLYGHPEPPAILRWVTVSPAIAYFYYLSRRLPNMLISVKVLEDEKFGGIASSVAGSILLVILIWKQVDAVLVGLAWAFLGLLLFEAGARFQHLPLRLQGYVVTALAFGRLFLANFTAPGAFFGISHRLISIVPIIAIFYYLVHRTRREQDTGGLVAFEKPLPQAYSYAAAVLLIVLARFEFGRSLTVLAWVLMGFTLFALGVFWRDRDLRFQGCLIAILTFWRSWSTNFYLIGSLYGIPERVATTIPIIVVLYGAEFLSPYWQKAQDQPRETTRTGTLARLDALSQNLFSILASLLLAILLYYEVQGNLLTVAWTLEGLGLMAAGFLIRIRTFRLSGLGLFGACLFKVFLIDLRGVEIVYRIFSFIILGFILLLVSFGYTKYKDIIRRYI